MHLVGRHLQLFIALVMCCLIWTINFVVLGNRKKWKGMLRNEYTVFFCTSNFEISRIFLHLRLLQTHQLLMKIVAIDEIIIVYTWNGTEVWEIFCCTLLIMKCTKGVHFKKWQNCGLVMYYSTLFILKLKNGKLYWFWVRKR